LEKAAERGGLGVTVIKPGQGIPELRERLAEYDLLITHFGLSAFEAIHARVPALLVSPGAYHEKLARHAGFFSAGIGPAAAARVADRLTDSAYLRALCEACEGIAARYRLDTVPEQNLGDLLAEFRAPLFRNCPCCGAPVSYAGKRRETPGHFPGRTYRRCARCGILYMIRSTPPTIDYETDYFFGFYKKQYGKTYLEDFPNLVETGKRRLAIIKRLLQNRTGPLLDIGCAYGPFLTAARDAGFDPQGIDPAEDAVRYVREELGIPARAGFFPDLFKSAPPEKNSFTAITLWYVLEHFEDLPRVLLEINRLLAPGGALAFATPSFSGISGRKSLGDFLKNSPQDHWTLWSPAICGAILARYGFALKKIHVSGHHPERFPLGHTLKRGGLLWNFLLLLSRMAGLGDTFEWYAVKVRLP
jgi:SAM-dependent methyltransferase